MTALLEKIKFQRIILHCKETIPENTHLNNFEIENIDDKNITICLEQGQNYNHLLTAANKSNLTIEQISYPTQKLAQIFLKLTEEI